MDLQNAQLLVLTLFLGSALVMPNNPYSRWLLLWGGQSQPAASLSWADPWMLQWIAEQEEKQAKDPIPVPAGNLGICASERAGDNCSVKQFLPRRVEPQGAQVVPRVIWQTWKDAKPGVKRFEGMNSMVLVNPEYDYVLMTDEDCLRFMCKYAEPDTLRAYQVLVPAAGKADIWRLAVLLKYGGIYVDSDVKALHPFREYLWPNASVASGMGRNKDFHQWLMIYAPGHPMIAEALKAVTETVLATYNAHTWKAVIPMTGPDRVHFYGIATVLKRNGCSVDKDNAEKDGLQLVREGHPCEQMTTPEPIGVVQVFDKDHLNGAVKFKVNGLSEESFKAGIPAYTSYNSWNKEFTNATGRCNG